MLSGDPFFQGLELPHYLCVHRHSTSSLYSSFVFSYDTDLHAVSTLRYLISYYCLADLDLLSTRTGFWECRATRAVVLPKRFCRKPLFPVDFRIIIEISCFSEIEMI